MRSRSRNPAATLGCFLVLVGRVEVGVGAAHCRCRRRPIDNHAVVEHGFAEAALRGAPLKALGLRSPHHDETRDEGLDHRLEVWRDRYPGVPVHHATARDGVAEFVADSQQPIQLAVIGRIDAGQILRLIDPVGGSIFDHTECSILVIRD